MVLENINETQLSSIPEFNFAKIIIKFYLCVINLKIVSCLEK